MELYLVCQKMNATGKSRLIISPCPHTWSICHFPHSTARGSGWSLEVRIGQYPKTETHIKTKLFLVTSRMGFKSSKIPLLTRYLLNTERFLSTFNEWGLAMGRHCPKWMPGSCTTRSYKASSIHLILVHCNAHDNIREDKNKSASGHF